MKEWDEEFYNQNLSKLKVGCKVICDSRLPPWNGEKEIVRTLIKIEKDEACGSGFRVWADGGVGGTPTEGFDADYFIAQE